jgi:superfamily II DNA or RNA helicase
MVTKPISLAGARPSAVDNHREMSVRLTPGGTLRLPGEGDWRELLLALASDRPAEPDLAFWRNYARRYLTSLCQLPAGQQAPAPPPPEREALVQAAPPMEGGEYLSSDSLAHLWEQLDDWVHAQVTAEGLDAFLQNHAPRWRQVGRVYFHLAENKENEELPFAFLATYTTGLSQGGRLQHVPLRKSLEQYAGARNKQALVKLLSPIQRASENCPWVDEMLQSGHIYKPLAWPIERAYQLLRNVPQLEEAGLSVLLPDWWKKRPRPRVSVTIGEAPGGGLGANALLQFDVQVAVEQQNLSPAEIRDLLAGGESLVRLKGQWVEVDREKLEQALEHWKLLESGGPVSFHEGMRLLAGASPDLRPDGKAAEEREWVHLQAGEGLSQLLGEPKDVPPDPRLRAELRPYQRSGVSWLSFLSRLGLGACLADDMGLGKTIQVLATLLTRKGPSLLIVPASLLGNWRAEAARFAPDLRLYFAHPSESNVLKDPGEADLVVTTYTQVTRQEWLREKDWQLLILDEAQAIKNAGTRQTQAVKKLRAASRIALTGTPVENRLGDLWSLFDFLNPGLLGSASVFSQFVKSLNNQFGPLRQLVGPYILRRLKTDRNVISDLPDKTETPAYCGLSKPQIKLYEKVLQTLAKALESKTGIARKGLVLQSLMQLKQICNHPSQFTGASEWAPAASGKFLRLGEICQELAERQQPVLIFTQFREIMDPLHEFLSSIYGLPGLLLHGGTAVSKRQKLVQQFQAEDGPPFFLLSLKAGGTGLNLTRASHVIHFDRWWNPAVENQATDRAFRIGQKNNVQVHKFISRGTLEERIDSMIAAKQKLANEILQSDQEVNLSELSNDELLSLVALDIRQATL